MRQDRQRKSFFSIRVKIIIVIYMVLFPVLIVTGMFIYARNRGAIMQEYTGRYQMAVDILNQSVGYFEQDLGDIMTYVLVNDDVGAVLRAPLSLGEEDPLFWRSLSPMNLVTNMLNVSGNIRTLILYPESGLVPYYSSQDGSVMNKDIEEIRQLELYQRALAAQGNVVWGAVPAGEKGLFERNRYDKIVLAREIFDNAKRNPLGFMVLSVDVSQYEQICRTSLLSPRDGIIMVDGQYGEIAQVGEVDPGILAYIREAGVTKTLLNQEGLAQAEDGSYIFAAPRDTDGWIFYLSPKSAWDARIQEGLVQPVLLALALLVSMWPVSLLASRIISAPIGKLHRSMEQFKAGDFSQQVQVSGHDEIAELSETFNQLVSEMKEMIDRNYVMVLRERESELAALQAQINPHFLYNALDSIYWQATAAGHDELSENILALSSLFRLVLSSGRNQITVRQEISLVTYYLQIQKMRFSKKVDYFVTVPEKMMDFAIGKLLLQPFVENAIVHGLERKDGWGCVQVRGEMEGDLLRFVIEDNGTGFSMETAQEILFADEDKRYANQRIGHYAIRNVKERIALQYGDRARLDIQSTPGVGTRICIEIPAEPYPGSVNAQGGEPDGQ